MSPAQVTVPPISGFMASVISLYCVFGFMPGASFIPTLDSFLFIGDKNPFAAVVPIKILSP